MASKLMAKVRRNQRGMTTAEYAVGSVAVATGVGTLITLFQQPEFQALVMNLVKIIFQIIQALLGAK
jgi:Flp pilus assembly pilin Flp